VGADVEWWASKLSGRRRSRVMGIRDEWWVPQSNGGIGDRWWGGGRRRTVVGVGAQWQQVCTGVEWWVCSQLVGRVFLGKRFISVAVVSNSIG